MQYFTEETNIIQLLMAHVGCLHELSIDYMRIH